MIKYKTEHKFDSYREDFVQESNVRIIDFNSIPDTYDGKTVISKDICRKPTVAIIKNGACMIPLCKKCFIRLKKDIEKIKIDEG